MDDLNWRTWDEAEPELRSMLPEAALETGRRAARAAERWHGEQTRPTGEPYTVHLLEALEVLARGAGERDPDVLAAALLHDVVEDTPATVAEVVYLGANVRVGATIEGGELVWAELRDAEAEGLSVGSEVALAWAPAAAIIWEETT